MFTYFLQATAVPSLRRYRVHEQQGERWDAEQGRWVPQCASRRACELTKDQVIDRAMVLKITGTLE